MEENELEIARIEAKKRLQGYIKEDQIGYNGYLEEEIKKILDEKGIEWNPKDSGKVEDEEIVNKENDKIESETKLIKPEKINFITKLIRAIKRIFKK